MFILALRRVKFVPAPDIYKHDPTKLKFYENTIKHYKPDEIEYTEHFFPEKNATYLCSEKTKAIDPKPIAEINYDLREQLFPVCENFTHEFQGELRICYFRNITRYNGSASESIKSVYPLTYPDITSNGIVYSVHNSNTDWDFHIECTTGQPRLVYASFSPYFVRYEHPLACHAGDKRKINFIKCTNQNYIWKIGNATLEQNQTINQENVTEPLNNTEQQSNVTENQANITQIENESIIITEIEINETEENISDENEAVEVIAEIIEPAEDNESENAAEPPISETNPSEETQNPTDDAQKEKENVMEIPKEKPKDDEL